MERTIGVERKKKERSKRTPKQRGLLSGARAETAETAGQAHWDLYPPVSETGVQLKKERDRSTSVV